MQPPFPQHLVWIQTAFVGDIVLSTSAFTAAKKFFPGVRQHLITTAAGKSLLANHECLDSIFAFSKRGSARWGGSLEAINAIVSSLDKAIPVGESAAIMQTHRSFRSSLLTMLMKRKRKWRVLTFFESSVNGWSMCTEKTNRVALLHETLRNSLLLELLGVSREQLAACGPEISEKCLPQWLPVSCGYQLNAQSKQQRRRIVVAPGSQWGTKRWIPSGFIEVCAGLLSEYDVDVILTGGKTEVALSAEIASGIRAVVPQHSARLYDSTGISSLTEMTAMIRRAELVIGNDSAPIHIASAVGTPAIAIFGPTIAETGFAPLAPRSVVLGVDLSCRPCSDHGPEICPLGHFKCMKDLSANRVLDACRTVLTKNRDAL